jgi:hypothetical protein
MLCFQMTLLFLKSGTVNDVWRVVFVACRLSFVVVETSSDLFFFPFLHFC